MSPSPNQRKLEHAAFDNGQLRGLKFSDKTNENKSDDVIVNVPRDLVLHTPLQTKAEDMDWDTNLSIQLLEEYSKGKASNIYG